MPLIEEFESSGDWLFKWRSYLPVFAFVPVVLSLPYYREIAIAEDGWPIQEIWEIVCLIVSFFGLFARIITVGFTPRRTSGRNTGKGQVADTLNTTGMYSLVRNPLYLGNFFIGLGFSLFLMLWWIPLIYGLGFMLYYERIIFAEEAFLREKFASDYLDWALKTSCIFPKFSHWQKSELSFSLKKVLKKEYHGFFGIIVGMFAMKIAGEFYVYGCFKPDVFWLCIFGLGVIVYAVIRFLCKKTALLKTKGR